jgi:hypothetical protein
MPLRFTDTVEPESVRWLWPGYIPFGKVTVSTAIRAWGSPRS